MSKKKYIPKGKCIYDLTEEKDFPVSRFKYMIIDRKRSHILPYGYICFAHIVNMFEFREDAEAALKKGQFIL